MFVGGDCGHCRLPGVGILTLFDRVLPIFRFATEYFVVAAIDDKPD